MRLRAAGERTAGGMAGDGGVTARGTAGGLSTAVWPAGDGGAMTARGTEGGEPVKTESVSVRSGSFGGGAR